jgi:predicted type IV restriction endonuclease
VLARFDYAPKDVVKATIERPEPQVAHPVEDAEIEDKAAPSEQDLAVFSYARDRLYFLVQSEALFDEVKKVQFRKSSGTFRVFYERPTAGALFNFREGKEHQYALRFPPLDGKEIAIDNLNEADEPLLQAFTQRVRERGITFEAPPVLRTITGGQVGKP